MPGATATEQYLIFKTCLYGAEPLGFDEQLVDDLGAALLPSAAVRALILEKDPTLEGRPELNFQVGEELDKQVKETLQLGSSAMYGSHLNNRRRRDNARRVAREVGGIRVVSLAIHTPDDIREERLGKAAFKAAKRMHKRLRWPDENEDYIYINGNGDLVSVIQQVMAGMEEQDERLTS